MARSGRPGRLRLFRDGRFLDEQAEAPAPLPAPSPTPPLASPPPAAPSFGQALGLLREHASRHRGADAGAPAPLLPAGSAAGRVIGWGCLVVVLLPLLLATLFFLVVAAASAIAPRA